MEGRKIETTPDVDRQTLSEPKPLRKARAGRPSAAPRMSEMMSGPQAAANQPLDRFSKTNHAYTFLRAQILDGVFRPGDWLRMSRIAASLNLSEMPVREALRLLEKDGLVINHLHRGVQVAALSFERALEITEVRMHLECRAALDAMPYHDAASLDAAGEVIDRMARSGTDTVSFALLNREFATAIYARCRNAFLHEHIQHLWDQIWQHSSTAVFDVMRHRIEPSLAENRRIVAALRAHDADMLRDAYDERLSGSLAAWSAAIVRSQSATTPKV